jgi:two-component system, NtrC family, response regulator AtoC
MMKSPTVFVVDKNPVHRSLISYNLIFNKFFNVHTFQSGSECLYRLQKHFIPDFLITDYNPDDYNGIEFVRNVKKISPSIRIIFFGECDDQATVLGLLESGAADYISKTGSPAAGISELIKNIRYLQREKSLS